MDFVCFSINNWEKRRARKQQFMLHLSLRLDVGKVLYVEPPLSFWRILLLPFRELATAERRRRWRRALSGSVELVSEKLFVVTPVFFFPLAFRAPFIYNFNLFFVCLWVKRLRKRLDFKQTVLWLYHPFDVKLLDWFQERVAACFDWAEEWSDYFREYSSEKKKWVKKMEDRIIAGVDFVFVVSARLLDEAKNLNPRSAFLRDGTIPEIFRAYSGRLPDDLGAIKRPILGYAGAVAARVDVSLVKKLSQELPDCSFVFVGAVHHRAIDISPLKSAGNVFFLGVKKYEELPAYLMNCDVLLLPYEIFPLTSPPTKIFDYMATGKPIVAAALPALEEFGDCVKLAHSHEEFVRFARESLAGGDPASSEKCQKIARENSWAVRAEEIMKILKAGTCA